MAIKVVNVDAAVAVEFEDFEIGIRAKEILKGFIERV